MLNHARGSGSSRPNFGPKFFVNITNLSDDGDREFALT
jgi:hypothetical protein